MTTEKSRFRVIDLSGYSFTGKSAFMDLFREFDGYYVPSFEFEFALLRAKNGILDLYHALIEDWSPVRSCEALRRFKILVDILSGDNTFLSRLTSTGYNYDSVFSGDGRSFAGISDEYINSLISEKWRGYWPYGNVSHNKLINMTKKILGRLRLYKPLELEIYLTSPLQEEFVSKTKRYLSEVLRLQPSDNEPNLILSNAFEPFNPSKSMMFFDDAKQIVVDRDPRDIYLSAQNYSRHNHKGFSTATGDNVGQFVEKFKINREKTDYTCKNTLYLRFEDLILNYESTVEQILEFLGESSGIHRRKKSFFNPEDSSAGVGMWKTSTAYKDDIMFIEEQLAEYCKQ